MRPQIKQCDICKNIYVYRENSTEQIRIIDYYVFGGVNATIYARSA